MPVHHKLPDGPIANAATARHAATAEEKAAADAALVAKNGRLAVRIRTLEGRISVLADFIRRLRTLLRGRKAHPAAAADPALEGFFAEARAILDEPRCPACGHAIEPADDRALAKWQRRAAAVRLALRDSLRTRTAKEWHAALDALLKRPRDGGNNWRKAQDPRIASLHARVLSVVWWDFMSNGPAGCGAARAFAGELLAFPPRGYKEPPEEDLRCALVAVGYPPALAFSRSLPIDQYEKFREAVAADDVETERIAREEWEGRE